MVFKIILCKTAYRDLKNLTPLILPATTNLSLYGISTSLVPLVFLEDRAHLAVSWEINGFRHFPSHTQADMTNPPTGFCFVLSLLQIALYARLESATPKKPAYLHTDVSCIKVAGEE